MHLLVRKLFGLHLFGANYLKLSKKLILSITLIIVGELELNKRKNTLLLLKKKKKEKILESWQKTEE